MDTFIKGKQIQPVITDDLTPSFDQWYKYANKPAETSTPAKMEKRVLIERVLSLDLSNKNATTVKNLSDFTDDESENQFDGSLEKVNTQMTKQINKARRNEVHR